jgi:hypothetical protein
MRRLAHALIVIGLLTALSGEVLAVLDHEAGVHGGLLVGAGRLPSVSVSIWSALGAGAVISGLGVALLCVRSLGRRRRRLVAPRPAGRGPAR